MKPSFFTMTGLWQHNQRFVIATILLVAAGVTYPLYAEKQIAVRLLWRTAIHAAGNSPSTAPVADGLRLFLVNSTVEAYSLDKGKLLWRSPLHRYVPRSLLTGNGLVFVTEDVISALDGKTGRAVWEFTPDANASLGRPALDGQTLYFGTASHRLYALQIADGQKLWMVDLGSEWEYPAVVRGVSVFQGIVYATVDQWLTPKGQKSSGWLVAVSEKDGSLLWRYRIGESGQRHGLSSSPAITERLAIAGDYLGNAIVAVDRYTGKEVWRFEGPPNLPGVPEMPLVAGDTVYAGSGRKIYALDLKTGRPKWQRNLSGVIEDYAFCGQSLLINYQGLAVLDRQTGEVAQILYDDEAEFVTSSFAVVGNRAFVAGPKAVYALTCR